MSGSERVRLVLTIVGALVAGGTIGAGVGLKWYSPAVGVGLAVLIGLAAGSQVLQAALRAKRRARSGHS